MTRKRANWPPCLRPYPRSPAYLAHHLGHRSGNKRWDRVFTSGPQEPQPCSHRMVSCSRTWPGLGSPPWRGFRGVLGLARPHPLLVSKASFFTCFLFSPTLMVPDTKRGCDYSIKASATPHPPSQAPHQAGPSPLKTCHVCNLPS